ncbi:MAG: HlyD family secretion protein [Planctomycetota bacterium]|jgi:HlyD family secretion protein
MTRTSGESEWPQKRKGSEGYIDPSDAQKLIRELKQRGNQPDEQGCVPDELTQKVIQRLERAANSDAENGETNTLDKAAPPTAMTLSADDRVEIHSVEVQDILGYIPSWIIRWGITMIAAVIIVLLLGSWLVKYPDIVHGPIVITSANPPVVLKARSTGKLSHLLVSDREKVTKNQYLAILENTANYKLVFQVKARLDLLRQNLVNEPGEAVLAATLTEIYPLGDLQSDYDGLLVGLHKYRQFAELRYHETKLVSLRDQLKSQRQYRKQLLSQKSILEEDYGLSRQDHVRTVELYEQGLKSQADVENSQSVLLQKQYSLEGARMGIISSDLQIAGLGQNILDLRRDSVSTETSLISEIKRGCDGLLSQLMAWEQQYVLKAPIEGVVSLSGYWTGGQNVSAGDNVLTVVPPVVADLVGRIELPIQGSGKVEIGQAVNVKLASYPHDEFGTVRGIVRSKSIIPENDVYILTVFFPEELLTQYGTKLRFTQNMKGNAEIVTENLRLLERIFYRARSYLTRT